MYGTLNEPKEGKEELKEKLQEKWLRKMIRERLSLQKSEHLCTLVIKLMKIKYDG